MATWAHSLQPTLIVLHRWLGIGLSLLMLAWFASGVVMVFHGYPHYGDGQRRAALADLQVETLRTPPASAARTLDLAGPPSAIRVTRTGDRPRMHLRAEGGPWRSVHADTGAPVPPLDRASARQRAQRLTGATATEATRLTQPDQWTFAGRLSAFRPLWRIAVADDAGSTVYLSERTGELVHRTDRSARLWGYAGPVVHWIYPTQLRHLDGLWRQLVMALAGVGAVLCLTGLALGALQWRRLHRRRPRGWRGWHHAFGLVFGLFAFTWVFSGLLSLDPFHWASKPLFDDGARSWIAGSEPPDTPTRPLAAIAAAHDLPEPIREIAWQPLAGTSGYRLSAARGATAWVAEDGTGLSARLSKPRVRHLLARRDGHALTELRRLTAYDAYHYPRRRDRLAEREPPLPVYRADYADGVRVYFDPARAEVVQALDGRRRLERWLYQGLHSLALPPLAPGSTRWYLIVLALLAGGGALSATGVWLTAAWLRRGLRRRRPRFRSVAIAEDGRNAQSARNSD